MTGSSSTAVLPTLVAVAASLFVARKLERHSIDETELARRGVHLKEGREMAVLERVTAGQAMRAGFEGVPASATAPQLQALVSKSRSNAFVVVDAEERMVGILSLQDLRILDQATAADLVSLTIAADLAERNVVSVFPDEPLSAARFAHGPPRLPPAPVVEHSDPRHDRHAERRHDADNIPQSLLEQGRRFYPGPRNVRPTAILDAQRGGQRGGALDRRSRYSPHHAQRRARNLEPVVGRRDADARARA